MATAAKHDVPLTLTVETVGVESIKQLKSDVAALGKQGADAVPEFAKLGVEIDKLANQASLVTAFGQLSAEVDELAAAQAKASQTSKTLASSLAEQNAATDKLRATELESKKALELAQQALFEKKQALAELKNGTTDYTAQARIQTAEIIKARGEIRELGQEYKAAKAATAEAAEGEKELASQLKTSAAITNSASKSLSERNAALNATKGSLDAAGIATDDFAAAEAALAAAHTKLTSEVKETGQALATTKARTAEMAESDRLLAIEQKGLAELFEKGRVALIAEETAFREAARSSAAYTAAREAESVARANAAALWQKEADAIVENVQAKERNFQETKRLIEAQNFMAAELAKDKWLEEAAAMGKANEAAFALRRQAELLAESQKGIATETAAATEALKKIDDAAREAGDGIADALGTVGVRSAAEIRIEIDKVKAALNLLQSSGTMAGNELDAAFAKGASKIKALERDLREATGQMTLADKAARAFSGAMGQFTVANIAADAIMGLVQRVQDLGRAFIDAVVQGDSMRRGLTAIYKDAGVAASQIDFLRKAAMENGVAVGQLSMDFVKFSAAMKSANIPLAQSNELFKAVTRASASLGIGSEATAGALNALGQMASKGVVSMEELRQQLGDRLPGALGLAAQGLGITEAQLVSLVGTGQLAARDFFGPFTAALKTMAGDTDGLVNSWDRLKTIMTTTAQSAGDAGWTTILSFGIKGLTLVLGTLASLLLHVTEGIYLLSAGVSAWTQSLFGNSTALEKWREDVSKSGDRIATMNNALLSVVGSFGASSAATGVNTVALSANTAEVVKSIGSNVELDGAQKLVALSASLAADSTLDAAAKIVQYGVAAAELVKKQGEQTEAYGKMAKAAKEEGDTLVALAKLTGDSIAIQDASVKAAELHAAALDKVKLSGESELAMLLAQKAELIASASTRQGGVEVVKVQVAELDKLIVKGQAETEQSRQASAAAAQQVAERRLLSETLKDNSSKIDVYKAAIASAKIEVDSLRAAEARGHDVKEQLANANGRLATSTALYRDAVKDSITNTELDNKLKGANLQLSIAQATASGNHYTALAAEARAIGDLNLATHYEIEAKRESIRVLELRLKLDKLQQDADLLIIDIKRKLIDAETDEGKQKLKLLDIETQMIKIRQAGNQAVQDQIRVIEAETTALRLGTDTRDASRKAIDSETGSRGKNTNAIYAGVDALEAEIAAKEKANDLADRAQALENRRRGVDSSGFAADKDGNRITIRLENQKTVYEHAKSQGLSDAQALQIADKYIVNGQQSNAGQGSSGGWGGVAKTWSAFVQEDIDKLIIANAANAAGTDTRGIPLPSKPVMAAGGVNTNSTNRSPAQIQADAANKAAGTTGLTTEEANRIAAQKKLGTSGSPGYTPWPTSTSQTGAEAFASASAANAAASATVVNINIGGVSTPVNVVSATDASKLQSVLQQLAAAQGRSI